MYYANLICNYEYLYRKELNNLCWVTEISPRQVAFIAIMRSPRPNLKTKHEIYYDIEIFYSRGARKFKLCLFHMYYNNIKNKQNVMGNVLTCEFDTLVDE